MIGGGSDIPDRADNRVLIPPTDRPPVRPPSDVIWSMTGPTMGTTWSVRAVAPPGAKKADLQAAIQFELDTVVALFSPWEPDSEITRFNTAPAGVWGLSDDFWALLDAAMDLADDTDGAVDPTLGALVDLWGFGPPGPRPGTPLPTDDDIAAALAVSGWQKLRLNRDAQAAMQPGGLALDVSGIAKGHAVDRVSDRLTALGATSHLVEIGGELRGACVKPDAQPWWVEIEQPILPDTGDGPAPRLIAALIDIAVATSGDYRRAFIHADRMYPHTIEGRTGRPVHNGLASVTVFDASAMRADALATALTVMGPVDGPAFAESMGLAAQFVLRTPEAMVERMTPAFAAMLDEGE